MEGMTDTLDDSFQMNSLKNVGESYSSYGVGDDLKGILLITL